MKSVEYFKKAEKLIARFSFREAKFQSDAANSRRAEAAEKLMKLPWSYMKNYEVVGTAGDVIVATDSKTSETVAIKVIEKLGDDKTAQLILPLNVPFMVPLIRYHENEFALYLVLKYISGGKLWSHLKKFMKRPSVYSNLNALSAQPCRYEGQRLLTRPRISTCVDDDEVLEPLTSSGSENYPCIDGRFIAECKSTAEAFLSFRWELKMRQRRTSLTELSFAQFSRDSRLPLGDDDDMRASFTATIVQRVALRKCKSLNDLARLNVECEASKECQYKECIKSEKLILSKDWKLRNMNRCSSPSVSVGSDTLSGLSDNFSGSFENVAKICNADNLTERDLKSIFMPSSMPLDNRNGNMRDNCISDLIRDSKILLGQVTKTLERSKGHSLVSSSLSRNSHTKLIKSATDNSINSTCQPETKKLTNLTEINGVDFAVKNHQLNSQIEKSNHIDFDPPDSEVHKSLENGNVTNASLIKNTMLEGNSTVAHVDLNNESISSGAALIREEPNLCDQIDSPIRLSSPYRPVSCLLDTCSSKLTDGDLYIPEGLVRVWISQVVLSMDNLHEQGIVWGKFCPSALLLDEGGSIVVTYRYSYGNERRGFFRRRPNGLLDKEKSEDIWASTLGYMAPEMMNPVSSACPSSDWWSIGALLYHLLNGKDFASCHPSGISTHTHINFVSPVSEEAASLITNLLRFHPSERLGGSSAGVQEIKDHPFFFGLEWPS